MQSQARRPASWWCGSAGSIEIEVTGAEGCDFEQTASDAPILLLATTTATPPKTTARATTAHLCVRHRGCKQRVWTVGGDLTLKEACWRTNTYRVYVTTPNEDDFVSAITGDENNPSFLRTSTSFYQNEFGGLTADQSNPFLFSVLNEARLRQLGDHRHRPSGLFQATSATAPLETRWSKVRTATRGWNGLRSRRQLGNQQLLVWKWRLLDSPPSSTTTNGRGRHDWTGLACAVDHRRHV